MEEENNSAYDSEIEDEVYLDDTKVEQEVVVTETDRNDVDLDTDMEDEPTMQSEETEPQPQDDSTISFLGHTDSVYCVALNSTNQIAVTGGGDDKAVVWKVQDGSLLFELTGHTDSVSQVEFNFDGKLIATGSYDGTVKIWNSQTGALMQTLEGPGEGIECLYWHPKGNVVIAGTESGAVWMWTADGKSVKLFAGHKARVTDVAFTLDGKQLLSTSEDATMRIWDPKTGGTISQIQGFGFHEDSIISMTLHPNHENIIATTGADGSVVISNISTGKPLNAKKEHTDAVESLGFCTTLPYMATGSLDKQVIIYDVNTFQQRLKCQHEDGVTKVVWHPTQPLFYASSLDKTVRLWDSRTGQAVKVWRGHKNGILDMAMASDGSFVMTASDDHASLLFKI